MNALRFASLLVLLVLLMGGLVPVRAQGPTETPTPTETSTPTPTSTITPTPDLYQITTLEPSGRAGAILYVITVGQAGIAAELAFIIVILLFAVFLAVRRAR